MNRINEKNKTDILNEYHLGNRSGISIASKLNLKAENVRNFLKRSNLPLQNNSDRARKYSVNENYFDTVDSPEKAYFFGLIMSDGHNCRSRNSLTIALNEDDKEILEKLKILINYSGPLKYRKRNPNWKGCYINSKNSWSLVITNKHISEQLELLGCMEKKTNNCLYPNIREDLQSHFIRGYFDGDGSLYFSNYTYKGTNRKKYVNVSFDGTKEFLNSLKKYLEEKLSLKEKKLGKRHKDKISNAYSLKYFNKEALKILNFIYKDSTIELQRKYLKAVPLLQSNEKMVN